VTVSAGTVARLSLLVLFGVVLQLAVVSQFTFWGANADLVPLIALAVGLLGGPIVGSVVGFSAGLVVDMALVQTLGLTSLLLTGVGYLGGRYRELRDATHSLVPPLAGVIVTLAYVAAFSLTQFLLGVDSSVSPLIVRDYLIEAIVNGLLAIPLFAAVRSLLRSSLVEPLRPRRRSPLAGVRVTSTTST
jgi:rod shape-determining protein MreD